MNTATAAIRITRRTRSLGFGWTTQTVQTRTGLAVAPVTAPDVTGGLAVCEAELARRARHVSGGVSSRTALFLGGRRVRSVSGEWPTTAVEMLQSLRHDGWIDVVYAD